MLDRWHGYDFPLNIADANPSFWTKNIIEEE